MVYRELVRGERICTGDASWSMVTSAVSWHYLGSHGVAVSGDGRGVPAW